MQAQTTECDQVYDFTVGTASISGINTSGWTSGKVIWVTGTLTVDQSVTFDNLQFIMKRNSAIVVTGGSTVMTTENGTSFIGCKQMWWGITVQSGAIVDMSSTSVKQAFMGLKFVPGANTTGSEIQNCILEDNLFGLFASGFSAASPLRFGKFSNVAIQASIAALLSPPSGVTYPGESPWRGIWLLNCHADLAYGASAKNKVKGYRYGMYVTNSNLTIANCRFDSNYGDEEATDPNDGVDVYAERSTVQLGGYFNQQCQFFNSENAAILSRWTRGLAVAGAKFQGAQQYGIHCKDSDFAAAIVVLGNEFVMNHQDFVSAIRVERPAGQSTGSGTLIFDNAITVPSTHTHFKKEKILIDVEGLKNAHDFADIRYNTLEVNTNVNRIHGIRIAGKGDYFGVWGENTLAWLPSTTPGAVAKSLGIVAKDLTGTGHLIQGNAVESKLSGSNSYLAAGIQASNATGTLLVCDNTLDNTHKGLECISGLPLTRLKTNDMGNAAYGLFCAGGTQMGDQDYYENVWTGSYASWGAFYDGSPTFIFRYDDNLVDAEPPSVSPSYWFDDNDGSDSECGIITTVPPITEREREFIDGTATVDTSAGNWDARRELIYKLLRYPELLEEDEDAEDYLDDQITNQTSPAKFARAEWLFDCAFALSVGHQEKFDEFLPEYRSLLDDLEALDEDQAADTTDYSLDIATDRAGVFDALAVVVDSLNARRASARPAVESELLDALDYAADLPQARMYEANLRNILLVAIRQAYAGDSVLTGGDHATLRSIAGQCPAVGGISVRRAPLHLPHPEDVTYVTKNWTDSCGAYQRAAPDWPRPERLAHLQPNPASDGLTLVFPNNSAGNWQVANLAGGIMAVGSWDSDATSRQLSVAAWPAGVYAASFYDERGIFVSLKFVVSH